jgi:hypothetical protein
MMAVDIQRHMQTATVEAHQYMEVAQRLSALRRTDNGRSKERLVGLAAGCLFFAQIRTVAPTTHHHPDMGRISSHFTLRTSNAALPTRIPVLEPALQHLTLHKPKEKNRQSVHTHIPTSHAIKTRRRRKTRRYLPPFFLTIQSHPLSLLSPFTPLPFFFSRF